MVTIAPDRWTDRRSGALHAQHVLPKETAGISPDIEIVQRAPDQQPAAEASAQKRTPSYIPLDPKDDKVLQAAIERLRNLESSQPYPSKSSSDSGR